MSSSPVTVRQLEYFVAAADTGSMTAAAAAVHVSQSAISMAIGDLERALDTQLFIRDRAAGLIITEAGRHVLDRARRTMAELADLVAEGRSFGSELRGPLTVACYATLAPFLMPQILRGFAERCPEVELRWRESELADAEASVLEGTTDVLIAYDLDLDPALALTPLAPTEPYVLLAADHPLAARDDLGLDELIEHPYVLLDRPQARDYFLGLFDAAGLTPQVAQRAEGFETVRSLVARRFGWSLLIQRPTPDRSYEGLAFTTRPLRNPARRLTVVAARRADLRPTARAEAFIDHCAHHLRGR